MGCLFAFEFFHVVGNCLVKSSRYSSSQFCAQFLLDASVSQLVS